MAPGRYRVKVVVRDAVGNAVENGWSQEYTVVPKLVVSSLLPDKGSPQAAEMATVRWNVEAQGGVGERTFAFRLSDGKTEKVAQEGSSALWAWSPKTPGTYRVKAVVRDALGNAAESGWSPDYTMAPKLEVSSMSPDKASPQAAEMATVRWKVIATGGVGSYRYEFRTTDGQVEKEEQTGALPTWNWSPKVPGTYRVKVVVRDAIGNAVDSGWSSSYLVAPPLVISLFSPDPVSPQAAGMAKVRWKVDATGGVGEPTIEFRTTDGKEEKREQGGTALLWDWSPQAPGTYKVKAVVRDAIGNAVDSGWSPEYRVVPKLRIMSVSPDKFPPQAAAASTVRWEVNATGGVEEREYSFWISDGTRERAEQKGLSPAWDWSPRDPGIYRVKVIVRDAIGNIVESGWSPEYRIGLTVGLKSLIAVMPVENLTGMPVAVQAVRRSLVQDLQRRGLNLLGEDVLEKFLERHRIRYTGGLNRELGEALREETGTNAVLFPTLELTDDAVPPKTALIARVVSTHRNANILWMDSAGMAGNDAPGFLLLGLINDPALLWEKAKEKVTGSLLTYLSGKTAQDARTVERRFLPKSFHGVPPKVGAGKETVSIAVLTFRNESTRRNAGEIMALHFIRELSGTGKIDVVEPGEVRQVLLRSRTIMEGGLSLPQADLLHDALGVDLVLTGIVMEYQDNIGGFGNPRVEFSARVFDMKTRQIVWSSASYNEGDDGVYFFNLGKVNTAHGMASEMVRAVVRKMEAAFKPGEDHPSAANPSGMR
jgi:TolB-like protein